MRLINEIRDDIMAAALRAAFDKCQKAHDVDTRELADAVHAHGYGAAAKLPDGWCSTSSAIHIQAPGCHDNRPEMKRDPLVMPKSRHMRQNQSSYPIKSNPDHPRCGTRMSWPVAITAKRERRDADVYDFAAHANPVTTHPH